VRLNGASRRQPTFASSAPRRRDTWLRRPLDVCWIIRAQRSASSRSPARDPGASLQSATNLLSSSGTVRAKRDLPMGNPSTSPAFMAGSALASSDRAAQRELARSLLMAEAKRRSAYVPSHGMFRPRQAELRRDHLPYDPRARTDVRSRKCKPSPPPSPLPRFSICYSQSYGQSASEGAAK